MTMETTWIFGKAAYLMNLTCIHVNINLFEELDERVRNCSIYWIELADWVILRI